MVQHPNTSAAALPSGYSPDTKIYRSLRPTVPLPPDSQPLSVYDYALSLLRQSPSDDIPFLVSSSTGNTLPYTHFLLLVDTLASSLSSLHSLSHQDVAFVISPPSFHVPLLYLALLRLRVVISPSNPLSTPHEVSHQLSLSRPTIAFATSSTSLLLNPSTPFSRGLFLLDSPSFLSLLSFPSPLHPLPPLPPLSQSLPAAILFSSGTTGRVKGVILTHRNLIALLSGLYHQKAAVEEQDIPNRVSLLTLPLFHVFGFFSMIKVFAFGETMVLMDERFDLEAFLRAVSRYRVTSMPVSPPLIVTLTKSDLTMKYDMSSLRTVACGGAPLGKEVAERFREKFPHIEIVQGYGMTETSGAATRTLGPDESNHHGSAGRLAENLEAKIVDPETGESLPPGQRGELWLRGPIVMTGYVGDDKSTAETLTPDGWLKTGDLCYFDPEGFLYIVDRLKELIKYKAYQVPPAELERLLHSNQEIADAAVIPYPDEECGEIPMALVVRKPGSSISESQVIDFIAKQVAPYKKVRRVAFLDSIPKSAAGKIMRRDLIKLAISNTSSRL